MFIISSSGGLEHQGGYRAGSGKPAIYVRRLYVNWHVHIQPRSVFVKETFAKSTLFEDPAPRFVKSILIQKHILLQLQLHSETKKNGGKKTRQKLKQRRENVRFPTQDR